jgi:hypothetical protein
MSSESVEATVSVAGRFEWSLAEFYHRSLVCIEAEQQKPLPDNALISVLCNAVRLGREYESEWDGAIKTHNALEARVTQLEKALQFCRDLASEELPFATVGTGGEVALRHIERRARITLETKE